MKPIIIFITFLLLLFYGVQAQKQTIVYQRFTADDGLSQTLVQTILQDHRGFLWFGTQDGLNRYDGYQFKVFKHSSNINALIDNDIKKLYEDKQSQLWVGTLEGISRYNSDTEQFTNITSIDSKSVRDVFSFYDLGKDNLFIGSGSGLILFEKTNRRFSYIVYKENLTIYSIEPYNHDFLWLATSQGLKLFNNKTFIINDFKSTSNDVTLSQIETRDIKKDNNHRFFVATFGNGIFSIDSATFATTRISSKHISINGLHSNYVFSLFKSTNNEIFAGHDDGAFIYDASINQFVPFVFAYRGEKYSHNFPVRSFFEDKSNILWMGGSNGVSKIKNQRSKFLSKKITLANSKNPEVDIVWGFAEHNDKNLWLATKAGLVKYDITKENFKHYSITSKKFLNEQDNNVFSVHIDYQGAIWLGTWVSGLIKFEVAKNLFSYYQNNPNDLNSLSNNSVMVMKEDSEKNLWIGTENGLNRLNRATQNFTRYFSKAGDTNSLADNKIQCIYKDNQNRIWIATKTKAHIYNATHNNFIQINLQFDSTSVNDKESILCIHTDKQNGVWIGTSNNGLYRLNSQNRVIRHYTDGKDLINNCINAIEEDNSGSLWISTNKGISRYNLKRNEFTHYDKADGLQSNEFNNNSSFQHSSGELYFGGVGGFTYFLPDSVKHESHVPQIVFTDFEIMNKSVPIGIYNGNRTILKKSITEATTINLNYSDYLITINFAALHFAFPEKNQYKYKLEGFDNDWIDNGTQHFVSYTNLPAGTYHFKVCGSNYDGIWNEDGISVEIVVSPPFWKTGIFITIIVIFSILVLIAAFFFLLRYRERRLVRYKYQLETEVRERTKELEQKEFTLIEQKNFIESVITYAKDGIVVIDLQGRFVRVNQEFTNIINYSTEEILQMNFRDITPVEWLEKDEASFKLLIEGTAKQHFEKEYYRKDGSKVPVSVSASTLYDQTGKPISVVAIVSDITERRRNETELEQYRRDLEKLVNERTADLEKAKERAEKADSLKTAFLANMSHEIRTPMNAIIGFSDLLKERDVSISERNEYISNISNSSNSLLHLIDDIIDIAKIEANQLNINVERCYINAIFNELLVSFKNLKQRQNKDDVQIVANMPIRNYDFAIYSDPYRVRQILKNLINNALKFTDKGRIEFGYHIENERSETIIFYVKDSGIGIPKDKIDVIFDRFRKLNENRTRLYGGTGLGLTITKRLVELLDGKIWVESEINVGSSFYFSLPFRLAESSTTVFDYSTNQTNSFDWSDKTILIAEDDDMNYNYLLKIFARTKANIIRANNGKEAYDVMKKPESSDINLVLMDIQMPIMDGYESTTEIRKINRRTPIIAQTAFAMSGDRQKCLEVGCNEYISKPFNINDFMFLLKNTIL